MTTNHTSQSPTPIAADEQPEVIYDDDPRFVGCSRFEWSTLRMQPRWRYILNLLVSPFPAGFIFVVMVLPNTVTHLFLTPDAARLGPVEGALALLGFWVVVLVGLSFLGVRSNERAFQKRYGRLFDWEIDEARAYFAAPHRAARPTFASMLRHYWGWALLCVAGLALILYFWGAGRVFGWAGCLVASLPWMIVRAEQIEWDDRLSKFGAYLCGPPAPATSPLDKS